MAFYRVAPIERYPVEQTHSDDRRSRFTFKAKWSQTLKLLQDELWRLEADNVILQLDVEQRFIRNDGGLYANATLDSPAVIISFDSTHGPLSYPCDSCEYWQHNVRSIALALQALRAVDRYGVTSRAEQYRGWAKIAQPGELMGFVSRNDAEFFLKDLVGEDFYSDEPMGVVFRKAKPMAHPDKGGSARQFKLVIAAEKMLLS